MVEIGLDLSFGLEPVIPEIFPEIPKIVPQKMSPQEDTHSEIGRENRHESTSSNHVLTPAVRLVFVLGRRRAFAG